MLRNANVYWESTVRTRCGISKIVPLDNWNVKKHPQWNYHLLSRANTPRLHSVSTECSVWACETWFGMERKERERVSHIQMLWFVCRSFLLSLFVSWCLRVFLSLSCTWIRVIKSRGHWLISANLTKDSKHVLSKCECKRIHQDMCMKPSNKIYGPLADFGIPHKRFQACPNAMQGTQCNAMQCTAMQRNAIMQFIATQCNATNAINAMHCK
jgi:hypothetical protein